MQGVCFQIHFEHIPYNSSLPAVPSDIDSEIILLLQLAERSNALEAAGGGAEEITKPSVYDGLAMECAFTDNFDFLKEVYYFCRLFLQIILHLFIRCWIICHEFVHNQIYERGRMRNFDNRSMLRQFAFSLMVRSNTIAD
jgi:hypothetical protein